MRRFLIITMLTCNLLGFMPMAEAKPISYVGGFMAMQENDETGHTLSLDYTVSPRYAASLYAKQEKAAKSSRRLARRSIPCSSGGTCRMARATSSI